MTTCEITVLGAGAGGLLTALVLANGGHAVRVLERDPGEPPDDDERAWNDWERPGVPQLRQPHALLGRAKEVISNDLPAVWQQLEPVGVRLETYRTAPDQDALTDNDRAIAGTVVRRTTVERALAEAAEAHPDIDVVRGAVTTGLDVTANGSGRPHVRGPIVDGGTLAAHLTIDSTGRRTQVGAWLDEFGVPVEQSSESDGFTYFGRWFRYEGALPPLGPSTFGGFGPGFVALVFPGDRDVAAVVTSGSARDPLFRRLRDPHVFMRVVGALPTLAPWVDPSAATPITDVLPMGSIQNRQLRLRTDTTPGVTGLVNTADSAVSTNPSLGRGIGLAADMAVRLRSLLADDPTPGDLADRWDELQRAHHRCWLADSIDSDQQMRSVFEAWTEGRPPPPPANRRRAAIGRAAMLDMECWRAWNSVNHLFASPDEAWYADPSLLERASAIAVDVPGAEPTIGRSEFESMTA